MGGHFVLDFAPAQISARVKFCASSAEVFWMRLWTKTPYMYPVVHAIVQWIMVTHTTGQQKKEDRPPKKKEEKQNKNNNHTHTKTNTKTNKQQQ